MTYFADAKMFAKKCRALRREKNLSQEQLADMEKQRKKMSKAR